MAELHLYEVPVRNHIATLRLSEEDAKALYGDRAKKIGKVDQARPEPVAVPSHAVDPGDGGDSDDSGDGEKAAATRPNKARSAANKSTA